MNRFIRKELSDLIEDFIDSIDIRPDGSLDMDSYDIKTLVDVLVEMIEDAYKDGYKDAEDTFK